MCERLNVEDLYIKGLTATDLAPLAKLTSLSSLNISWAHKFTDVTPLRALTKLKSLKISDTKRWHDLSQLAGMEVLSLDLSGGIDNDNIYQTFEPLAGLPRLDRLRLWSTKVEQGGLRPLAHCKALTFLQLDRRYPTEDYAYLSVKLPDVECEELAPYVKLNPPYHKNRDVLVVGFRKPALSTKTDTARLTKYVTAFEGMQASFRKED